jgi:hypothetical protein
MVGKTGGRLSIAEIRLASPEGGDAVGETVVVVLVERQSASLLFFFF